MFSWPTAHNYMGEYKPYPAAKSQTPPCNAATQTYGAIPEPSGLNVFVGKCLDHGCLDALPQAADEVGVMLAGREGLGQHGQLCVLGHPAPWWPLFLVSLSVAQQTADQPVQVLFLTTPHPFPSISGHFRSSQSCVWDHPVGSSGA